MKVSDYIAQWLESKGMRHVFGIVGAGDAHLFDSIASHGFTQIVCVHHEQAACMAVQTYYRTSGVVTAAVLTTGGGSTNATTGVVGAWADSIPAMVISGNENSKYTTPDNPLRMWGVQGYDSSGMMAGVTKFQARVMDPLEVGATLELAYQRATEGRPGPVWVDIPMNVQSMDADETEMERRRAAVVSPAPEVRPEVAAAAKRVADLLRSSERPVLWLGHGIRLAGAVESLPELLAKTNAPSLLSWAGMDMVESDHPLVFGRAGVYGNRHSNFVLQNSDLVVAIGTRLALPQIGYDLSELARDAKLVVVDVDPTEAHKLGERVSEAIVADAKEFLRALLCELDEPLPRKEEWLARCEGYRTDYPLIGPEHADTGGFINSYPFMDRLSGHLKADEVVVTDMGTALLSGHQVLRMKESQRMMTSTGLGEMGFGLPAAIGASFARDRGEVLCLNCDGGMMMNLQELQTIVHHELPIKIFVFNNDGYLMIKHTQKALFKGRYSGTDVKSGVSCPDFTKLAAAFGMPAFQIRTWEDFDAVIPQVQSHRGPLVCEVFMHPEQTFVPKLSLAVQEDGTLVSPPLEDLSPLIPREELGTAMLVGVHPKSLGLKP